MFNSLKCAIQLEEAGFTRKQAETHVQVMTDLMEGNFASKQDMTDIRQEMADMRFSTNARFDALEERMEHRFKEVEYRLTIKLGSIVSLAIGVAVTLSKLL